MAAAPRLGGGGRRVATNILAQLRHGQLSGNGLTRGAQVRRAWRGRRCGGCGPPQAV